MSRLLGAIFVSVGQFDSNHMTMLLGFATHRRKERRLAGGAGRGGPSDHSYDSTGQICQRR